MGNVTYTEEIEAAPEHVWNILTDVTRLPDWAYAEGRYPHPVEGKYGSEQTEGVGTLWIGIAADGQAATQKVTVWDPPKKLAYELLETENAALEMSQANTFEIESIGENKCRVTWNVEWAITSGFSLNSLMVRFGGNGAFEEMMAGSLEKLKALAENEATTEAV